MAVRWSVPPIFAGKTVAVFATGPSLTREQCDGWDGPSVVVNDAFRLKPEAEVLYAADGQWWRENKDALEFKGLKVTCMASCQDDRVMLLQQAGIEGFDDRPTHLRTGGNSGYQAIHVAIQAKAKTIKLFGFDMHGTHFFGKHKAPLRNTEPEHFAHWAPRFDALNGRGSEIINCTPGSALTCFPFEDAWAR
jgi:hypothetical protein